MRGTCRQQAAGGGVFKGRMLVYAVTHAAARPPEPAALPLLSAAFPGGHSPGARPWGVVCTQL